MAETIIGIDLGTTNSEVAIYKDGRVMVLEDNNSRIIPSYVGLDDNGEIIVGEEAKNQYQVYPERTIKSIKRKMGRDEKIVMGTEQYLPQELSAIILRKLKLIAEKHLNCRINKAVITVPAYFSDAQRQATREAGEIAGLEVVKIINEPTAAALSYKTESRPNQRILIYDLGGGTFDVSVVQIEGGVVEVIASHGNNHLGGDDFDQKIVSAVIEHLKVEHNYNDTLSSQAMARIEQAAENAKKALSDNPFALIAEEYLCEIQGVPVNLNMDVAREDYEEMIRPYIDETLEAVHTALKSADLAASHINEVLLVGGSTRTPLVARRLEEKFGFAPRCDMDPDLCVAMGAAMQAAMIKGEDVHAALVDITPYTFGTRAYHEDENGPLPYYFVPIIKKNTPIPVRKSDVFYTMYDNQQKVEIGIYQGENEDVRENVKIGEFMIKGLSRAPANNELITTFELDKDGILHVTSKEKKTGLQKMITIDNAMSKFEEEELNTARERISNLFTGDESGAEGNQQVSAKVESVKAMAVVEKAESLFELAESDDCEEMINLIEAIKEADIAGDKAALSTAVDELSEIIFFLES
ncbi:MAG: Hsp70 family protein [Deltaproteobacteria bacterium]|nr:Hsp70 family protein [Deltaproteobacteria bacterium]